MTGIQRHENEISMGRWGGRGRAPQTPHTPPPRTQRPTLQHPWAAVRCARQARQRYGAAGMGGTAGAAPAGAPGTECGSTRAAGGRQVAGAGYNNGGATTQGTRCGSFGGGPETEVDSEDWSLRPAGAGATCWAVSLACRERDAGQARLAGSKAVEATVSWIGRAVD